jgi:hypothetical protein
MIINISVYRSKYEGYSINGEIIKRNLSPVIYNGSPNFAVNKKT